MARRKKPDYLKKKSRTISATDNEWIQVIEQSKEKDVSSYVLDKLKVKRD